MRVQFVRQIAIPLALIQDFYEADLLPIIAFADPHDRVVYLSGTVQRLFDLSRADLQGANLSGATLRGADLSEANLYGADLTGASMIATNLAGATLPDGTKISS